ncbi:MAG TPA: hypothetical protein VNN72_20430 [Polyangiaceae bacterium]|nr:hypothetical protein [Polyangiaceae bacterium]
MIVRRTCGLHGAVGLFAMLLLGSMASPAAAQDNASAPTPAQVRAAAEAFDLGRQSYKDGRYAEAAEQFERADSNAPSSTALELAIRSRDKAGDLDRAGTLAALALALYPDDENISKIAPDVVSRAGASTFELTVTCAEPCEIADGQQIVHGNAARQRTLFLAAGTHSLRAGYAGGKTESKSVDAVAGGSGTLDFSGAKVEDESPSEAPPPEPKEEPPPPAEEEPKRSGLPPTVVWIGAGATAVAGGVTIWSGIDTVNNPGADKVKAECPKGDTSCALYKDGRSKQARTNILLGVTGGLAVATGLIAAIAVDWGPPSLPGVDSARRKTRVRPYFTWQNGPSIGARGSF